MMSSQSSASLIGSTTMNLRYHWEAMHLDHLPRRSELQFSQSLWQQVSAVLIYRSLWSNTLIMIPNTLLNLNKLATSWILLIVRLMTRLQLLGVTSTQSLPVCESMWIKGGCPSCRLMINKLSPLQVELMRHYSDLLIYDDMYNCNNCGYPLGIGIRIDSHGKSWYLWYVMHTRENIASFTWILNAILESQVPHQRLLQVIVMPCLFMLLRS